MHRHVPLVIAVTVFVAFVCAGMAMFLLPVGSSPVSQRDDHVVPATSVTETAPGFALSVTSSAFASLVMPSLDYLERVAGDPVLEPGEIGMRIPILMYHRIAPITAKTPLKERRYMVTPESFTAQMESLVSAGYHTISADDLRRALTYGWDILPSKPVILTFDDGFRDQYEYAFPVLKRLQMQATFFIISNVFSSPAHVTKDMIRDMDASGLITIGSHTRHHVYLGKMGRTAARSVEIKGSKEDLEKIVGHPIQTFAYPFGSWTEDVVREVEQAGYTLGFGVRLGSLQAGSSRFLIRRIPVANRMAVVPLCDRFSAIPIAKTTKKTVKAASQNTNTPVK